MTNDAAMARPDHGTMEEGFGSRAITRTAETATSAMQAAATAAVQARFVMALQRPRSWADCRVRVLADCKRPGFAEAARYRKPVGKGIEGPSIRFAEACLRYAGNLGVETSTTFEDERQRILHVVAIDYETNASFAADVTIHKTVERRDTRGRAIVSQRQNSNGQTVYIVEATDDEILNTANALVSKAARTLILRLIPADIVEEGQAKCIETIRDQAKTDPAGFRRKLCDGFAELGVLPRDLEAYLGHPMDALSPVEATELRAIYATIRDGELTWKAVMAARGGEGEEGGKKSTIAEKVRAKAAAAKAAKGAKPAGPSAEAPAASAPAAEAKPVSRAAPTEAPPAPSSAASSAPAHDPATGEMPMDDGDRGDNPDDY